MEVATAVRMKSDVDWWDMTLCTRCLVHSLCYIDLLRSHIESTVSDTSRWWLTGILIRFSTGVRETTTVPVLPLLPRPRWTFIISLFSRTHSRFFSPLGSTWAGLSCLPGDMTNSLISERSVGLPRTSSLTTGYLLLDNTAKLVA